MTDTKIHNKKFTISISEFTTFLNSVGTPKLNSVKQAIEKRKKPFAPYVDYWHHFKKAIIDSLKQNNNYLGLDVLDNISKADKKESYKKMIPRFNNYFKGKSVQWFDPPRSLWNIGEIDIRINPELGLIIDNQPYIIKLFISNDKIIGAKKANMILNLLELKLRDETHYQNAIFAVLDVRKRVFHKNDNMDTSLEPLLVAEAQSFESIYKYLQQ